jgi:hypothetical protein
MLVVSVPAAANMQGRAAISRHFTAKNAGGDVWCIGALEKGKTTMRTVAVAASAVLLCAGVTWTDEKTTTDKAPTPEALVKEIDALKPANVAWREIAWKSCLLEGLKESRAKNKPLLVWVFIDRPTDDARC